MDTLAVQLTIPPAGFVWDSHPQVNAPCWAHKKKGDRFHDPLERIWHCRTLLWLVGRFSRFRLHFSCQDNIAVLPG